MWTAPAESPDELLVELLSRMEEFKFRTLVRALVDKHADYPGDSIDLGTSNTYIFERYLSPRYAATNKWIFQTSYLPTPLYDDDQVQAFFTQELRAGLNDLRDSKSRARDALPPDAEFCTYYFVTNAPSAFFADIKNVNSKLYCNAKELFLEILNTDLMVESAVWEFGAGNPITMASSRPKTILDEVVTLLNMPSEYSVIAREGQLTLLPTSNYGIHYASNSHVQVVAEAPTGLAATLVSLNPASKTLQDFTSLINATGTKEADLQAFLEDSPEFLLALDDRYTEIRPHVALIDKNDNRLIPDFLARIEDSNIWDVIELKTPQMRSNRRDGKVSADLARGISELLRYRNYFGYAQNRKRFADRYGSTGYEPALILVLGRGRQRYEWSNVKTHFPKVKVVSFDYLLQRTVECRQLLQRIVRREQKSSSGRLKHSSKHGPGSRATSLRQA